MAKREMGQPLSSAVLNVLKGIAITIFLEVQPLIIDVPFEGVDATIRVSCTLP